MQLIVLRFFCGQLCKWVDGLVPIRSACPETATCSGSHSAEEMVDSWRVVDIAITIVQEYLVDPLFWKKCWLPLGVGVLRYGMSVRCDWCDVVSEVDVSRRVRAPWP